MRLYNPHFVSKRERWEIIEKYYNQYTVDEIAILHNLQPSTINTYIRRYRSTNTIETEAEIQNADKLGGRKDKTKILDPPHIKQAIDFKC